MEHLIDRDKLGTTGESLRRMGKRIVFTNGCFDLLHPGHMRLLARCASLGDCVIVGINDDGSVRRLKGPERPVYEAEERAELLLAVRWVDMVTVFSEDTPLETIECLRPDVLVKGGEYLERDIVGAKFVRSYGGTVARVPMKKGHSSRLIVRRIAE
jgi:D-beta-D-heptose 7-phosphate kinase/D-beta-D-heptose 1-phosphate adenosyltransferase